jgi:hypothetical protein
MYFQCDFFYIPAGSDGIVVPDHTHLHAHSVGLLWTRDQPISEISDTTPRLKETDIHSPSGIRTRIPRKRAAADLCLKMRGHRDRPYLYF